MSGTSVCDECVRDSCWMRSDKYSSVQPYVFFLIRKMEETNCELVRSMTDEELAKALFRLP